MSDGTTAVQVSPIPTESEMASIRAFFANVTNALVNASELSVKVKDLEARFASLNEDHTRVMARSDQLEQSLSEARAQRDEAQAKLSETTAQLELKSQAFDNSQRNVDYQVNKVQGLRDQLDAVIKQRDYNLNEWVKETARADEYEAKLNKIHSALGIVDPPKSEPLPPQAEPIPEARPLTEPEVAQASIESPSNPEPYSWDPNKF